MKEWTEKKVIVKLESAEEEAIETVLNLLERMTYIYEEEGVDVIYTEFDDNHSQAPLFEGTPERAIQALEEINGTWA